jgi:hypothetical protein
MNKRATFDLDSLNKAVNLNRLSGINHIDRTGIDATEKSAAGDWVVGFGLTGYREYFLDGDVSPEKKETIMKIVSAAMGKKRCLPLPNGGKISVDIIGEIFISAKTDNLIITSIAQKTVLFIAEKDKFNDLELLLSDFSKALVAISTGKTSDFNWDTYTI